MRSIVIGLGETGEPLLEILRKTNSETIGYDFKDGIIPCWVAREDFEVLHICIPYSHEFISTVREYQKFCHASLTIIHSTVPIGTTSQIPNAVHSPIRGKHGRMKEDLLKYPKWVGGEKAEVAGNYLKAHGFDVRVVETSEQTEAMKLLCLAKYGKDISFAYYCNELADKYNFPYNDILAWDVEYNNGVEARLKRPLITNLEGTIGGHCVVQNTKVLNKQHPNPMLTEILKYDSEKNGKESEKHYKAWGISNIYETANIGKDCNIGWFCEIGNNVTIGDRSRIGAFCYIPEGVTIGEDCFIAPRVTFTNDKYPPSGKEHWLPTVVKRGARIGAGTTIVCGVTIGENALVGAGSVVTKDIGANEVWYGVPASRVQPSCVLKTVISSMEVLA
mgnify:CR=1 FL=1